MSSSNRSSLFNSIVIFIILFSVLAITYSLSSGSSLGAVQAQATPSETTTARLKTRSKMSGDRVMLVKDNKLVIDKICLDYKGIDEEMVLIDLYLLELDDEQPYLKKIRRQDIDEKDIRFGDHTYRLVSANDSIVKMELIDIFSTP